LNRTGFARASLRWPRASRARHQPDRPWARHAPDALRHAGARRAGCV